MLTLPLLVAGLVCVQPGPAPAGPTYLLVGRLFDGTGDAYRLDQVITVEGDRIKAVGPADQVVIPPGATRIDLSRSTVLPGLIDCHTHLGSRADRYDEIAKFKDTPNHSAFAAVLNARKTLEAGFTTVRDLGSKPFLACDLRDAIAEGFLVGPRIVASGPGISMTGGHGDLNHYAPQVTVQMFPAERDFKIADGVDQVRRVVRAQLKHGVDVIKVPRLGRSPLARRRARGAAVLGRGADGPGRGSPRGGTQGRRARPRRAGDQERGPRGGGFDRTRQPHRRRGDRPDG